MMRRFISPPLVVFAGVALIVVVYESISGWLDGR